MPTGNTVVDREPASDGAKSEYWVSTLLSYPLHLVSEAAMTAD